MNFEWNKNKSRSNKEKHGIFFEEAISLWKNTHIRIDTVAKTVQDEKRHAVIGEIDDKVLIAFWTKRKNKIRIISVRRARDAEKKAYYKKIQNI